MPGVGQQTRSAFLVQSQVDRADCELRPAQPDNNLDKVLQNYGLQGLEFREPLSANQLEQLTGQFPGSKLETWGNRVTIAERDLVLGATSAELVRQLANWKHATEGYIVGGGDTAFTMFVHNRLLAASKADSYAAGKREWQRALLVPDAWLMRRSYYREVCKGGVPQLEGCRDALLVECSRLTDSYGIGRGLVSQEQPASCHHCGCRFSGLVRWCRIEHSRCHQSCPAYSLGNEVYFKACRCAYISYPNRS